MTWVCVDNMIHLAHFQLPFSIFWYTSFLSTHRILYHLYFCLFCVRLACVLRLISKCLIFIWWNWLHYANWLRPHLVLWYILYNDLIFVYVHVCVYGVAIGTKLIGFCLSFHFFLFVKWTVKYVELSKLTNWIQFCFGESFFLSIDDDDVNTCVLKILIQVELTLISFVSFFFVLNRRLNHNHLQFLPDNLFARNHQLYRM